jgi:hypothetical protein
MGAHRQRADANADCMTALDRACKNTAEKAMNKNRFGLLAAVLACLAAAGHDGRAQAADVRFQAAEGVAPRQLTQDEKDKLQDPLFRLVLNQHADVIKLTEVERLIQPDPAKRRIFVIDEEIKDPRAQVQGRPQARRAVIDFLDKNGDVQLGGRVMLSIFFFSSTVPDIVDIEAWGFDDKSGHFNYYKLDRQGQTSPSGPLIWKFRGSSADAERLPLTASARAGMCVRCHTSGVPVMKELLLPWNNWQSLKSPNAYLTKTAPGHWPVVDSDPHFSNLADAYSLESTIKNSILPFSIRKLDRLVTPDGQGGFNVADAKALLQPLFDTTEVNLASAQELSGLHPLSPGGQTTGPSRPVAPPDSFFLVSGLLGKAPNLSGLGIPEASDFGSVVTIQPDEYKALVAGAGLRITRADRSTLPGDANFAWFTPEPGFAALQWINTLVQRTILSPAFVAAALAVDLETPVFSDRRKSLLDFIPASVAVTPGESHPDRLTREVIQRLQASTPAPGSAAAEFLDLLQKPSPVDEVRQRIIAYRDRVDQRLKDPATRQAELQRLFDLLVQRRTALIRHPMFGCLKESDALLPLAAPINPQC